MRYSSHKYIYTKQLSYKFYEAKWIKLKRKIDKAMIIVGNFNTHLSKTDRTRKKNSKDLEELNNSIDNGI